MCESEQVNCNSISSSITHPILLVADLGDGRRKL